MTSGLSRGCRKLPDLAKSFVTRRQRHSEAESGLRLRAVSGPLRNDRPQVPSDLFVRRSHSQIIFRQPLAQAALTVTLLLAAGSRTVARPRTPSWTSLTTMAAPQPMLGVSARRWPSGGRWVLQPKWDGFRLLIHIGAGGEVRAWSRHGTDLTARLGSLLAPFADVAPGTIFDGELVIVGKRGGRPAQDFAAVTRAVFTGHPVASDRLRFVAFDLLAAAGQDLRPRPWEERDARAKRFLSATGFGSSPPSLRRLRCTRRSSRLGSRGPS